jgi:hypothetical protein
MKLLLLTIPLAGPGYFKNQAENKDQYPNEVWVTVKAAKDPSMEQVQEAVEMHMKCSVAYIGIGRASNEWKFARI